MAFSAMTDEGVNKKPKIDRAVRGLLDIIPDEQKVIMVRDMSKNSFSSPSASLCLDNVDSIQDFAEEFIFQSFYDILWRVFGPEEE